MYVHEVYEMKYRAFCGVAAAVFVSGAVCVATEGNGEGEARERKAKISVGAGAIVTSKPYRGTNARVYPVPMFSYEGRRFYFRGVAAGYRLFEGTNWSLAPVLSPRFDGYDENDSSALWGMDDRDVSLDAGLAFTLRGDWGVFGAALVTDVLGKHDGQELELSYSKPLRWEKWTIAPALGLHWQSSNLVDYYYGVRVKERRAGRPAYDADEAVNPFVALRVQRRLGKKWNVLGAIQYEWFDDEISDSPIVDDNYDISVVTGVLYTF